MIKLREPRTDDRREAPEVCGADVPITAGLTAPTPTA
jgi:hypothetical protein